MLKYFITACRKSILLDSLNLAIKLLLHPESQKLKVRAARLRLVRAQGASPFICEKPQIFIDISSLVINDNATGIHRAVRSIALHTARMGDYKGYRLSLVYASKYREGYYHAFRYQAEILGIEAPCCTDLPISFKPGDIFYELDWNTTLVPYQRSYYQRMYDSGVSVYFHVYDILPLQLTDINNHKAQHVFESWLFDASKYTGVLCNSKSVCKDYAEWRSLKGLRKDFLIGYYYLGSDIENSLPSVGMPDRAEEVLSRQASRTNILMVSALDPRKGYDQTLSAFELLWKKNIDIDLIVVGKALGNEVLARRFRQHPEQHKRFYWFEGISDEFLQKLYEGASAVLFASRGEGFGLAVWEGARYGKPLILRDLPVFRELAGEYATYFRGEAPESLAAGVEFWWKEFRDGKTISSKGIQPLLWDESVQRLMQNLTTLKNHT